MNSIKKFSLVVVIGLSAFALSCGEMYSEIPEWSGSVDGIFVVYNGNGASIGSPPVDPATYIGGQEVEVMGNTGSLDRTGYTFDGWNTAPNGSGLSYIPGATFNIGAGSVTLYAQWTPIPYSVTYNGNGNLGGTVPVDGTVYYINDTVTVQGNPGGLVRIPAAGTAEAFKFGGWNTASNGSGITYTASDTFTMGSVSITLYALWVPFELRDAGPAGGLIFYDKGSFSSGWRYLEAALENMGPTMWGNEIQTPGNQGSAIGAGYQNTIDILSTANAAWAAHLCDDYVAGGYSDWFLPSYGELSSMRTNLHLAGVGGFLSGPADGAYWSSTETDSWYPPTYAIEILFFYDGLTYWQGQSYVSDYCVRPARRF